MRASLLFSILLSSIQPALPADQAAAFFDDSAVREIRLYFEDPNWYNTLFQAHSSNPEDPYFPARFQYGTTVIDKIGARFKGNASFRRGGVKKSFKLDFNEYDENGKFLGLKKLNLNNGDLQPDFLREKLFLDFAGKYIAAMRAVHVRLYVNDVYYGLYIAVEQPDKTMMESRFGGDEDGNLYEAGEMNASMAYLGTDPAAYRSVFELKTNEEANDYSGLIQFLDILNNTPAAELESRLSTIADVDNLLYGIALNILFVNLDSYAGSASEYFLYQRTSDKRFIHIHWDLNESFGTTGDGSPRITTPATLDAFWLPGSTTATGGRPGGGGGANNARPLMEKLWAVDSFKRTYLRMLARMTREGFDETTYTARVKQLADLIRPHVIEDPNKLFTAAQFETALNSTVSSGQTPLLGVTEFIRTRRAYLRPWLDTQAQPSDVRLNEIVSANPGTMTDEAGDADPWVEIYNQGPGPVNLSGLYLSDNSAVPTKWALPARTLADGEMLVIWLDGETNEGAAHANFRLSPSSGGLFLYNSASGAQTLLDGVQYPELAAGRSYIRLGNSGARWASTNLLTPAKENPATGVDASITPVSLRINEFLADNKTTLVNPDKADAFDDWVEIYNSSDKEIDMSGMYLTDNLANPTKYRIPDGVKIAAKGYLVFWADEETKLGPLHASFKLGASGEEIGLIHTDGATIIDSITFGQQQADVSYGRSPDGGDTWKTMQPTPGKTNN
ncbi:MAG: CotH kinase family protein [Acidobacteria bacterium]|nr:CotH kinase family protein [Acidobacteriota bacterium]